MLRKKIKDILHYNYDCGSVPVVLNVITAVLTLWQQQLQRWLLFLRRLRETTPSTSPVQSQKFNSHFIGASCHCLNGQSPPSNRERPGSVPWDVRRAKWKRRMVFSQHFGFSTGNYHPGRSGRRKCRIGPTPNAITASISLEVFPWYLEANHEVNDTHTHTNG